MRTLPTALALVCFCATLGAQRHFVTEHQPSERVAGLLDLPDITSNYREAGCKSTELASIPTLREPSETAPATGAIRLAERQNQGCELVLRRRGYSVDEELPSQESVYEIPAAVVYERRDRWFRIAVPRGSAWIERENADSFRPYPQILVQRLSYLRKDWDGLLRRSANAKAPALPLPAGWNERLSGEIGIQVLRFSREDNDDWIRVRLVTERCGDKSATALKAIEGWVPAHRADGQTTAWFHSKGC